MATFDYDRAVATADRLIAKFGRTGKLRRPTSTGPAYDPTEGVPVDTTVTFVVTSYKDREIDGSRILASDKKALVSASGLAVEPTTAMLLVAGTERPYNIVDVQPLNPAGTVVFYTLQVRR